MFDHVDIHVSDLGRSRRFYVEALGAPTADGDYVAWGDFGIEVVSAEHRLTRRLHVGFAVPDRAAVDEWWRRLTAAGYESDGEPGPRPQYSDTYYGAFVLDPDGNSIEAVHHENTAGSGMDHLWLRARDVAAAKRFYETIGDVVGIRIAHDSPDRVQLTDGRGSFSFVAGDAPTEHVHLAFGVATNDVVDEFHRAATAAGFESNGGPGERAVYHPGYYGAFVFDSDGNNVEAVCHNR